MAHVYFSDLFSPLRIGALSLKNRIVMPPMSTNLGHPKRPGFVSERHKAYYRERAKGGAGLIIVEATAASLSKSFRKLGLGLYDGQFIHGLSELAALIHQNGAACGIQIIAAEAGRIGAMKVGCRRSLDPACAQSTDYLAASPFVHPVTGVVARELSVGQIAQITKRVALAAKRANQAGFDVIEIHGAHGYLLHEFLSQRTNRRTDRYGGDLDGRSRFALEVIAAVKSAIGTGSALSYRMSASEFMEGGFDIDEAVVFARKMQKAGVDVIHVSGGTNETLSTMNRVIPPMSYPCGRLIPYAHTIKAAVSVPVIAVQRINTPELADEVIREGEADLVATGRALIADPYWPIKAYEGRVDEIRRCIACNQGCMEQIVLGNPVTCLHNPQVGYEDVFSSEEKEKKKKKVLVVGGGPAGMEAACVLAEKGHSVRLVEKDNHLGGMGRVASVLEEKKEFRAVIEHLVNRIMKSGVDVRLRERFDIKGLDGRVFDEVIVATGSTPIMPLMSSDELDYTVLLAGDVLKDSTGVGQSVVIIGGGSVGIEVAEYLCHLGKRVTVVEMLDTICADLGPLNHVDVVERVERKPIDILLGTSVVSLDKDGIRMVRKGKEEIFSAPETVIVAMGGKPAKLPLSALQLPFHYVGDCLKTGNAMDAIHQAFRVAMGI